MTQLLIHATAGMDLKKPVMREGSQTPPRPREALDQAN